MNVYSIGQTAEMTGLSEFTLRAWEKRYKIRPGSRSESGRRLYSLSDIERLRLLSALSKLGHSLVELSVLPMAQLSKLARQDEAAAVGKEPWGDLMEAVERVDVAGLRTELRRVQLGHDTRTMLLKVVGPLLREIGRRVIDGELDVYHEHAASAVIRGFLSGILYSTENPLSAPRPPMIFATPEGDFHEFGIFIAAILAMLQKIPVIYLGPNMPAESLNRAVRFGTGATLVLSCSAPSASLSEAALARFLGRLGKDLPSGTELWLGGERLAALAIPESKTVSWTVFKKLEDFEKALRAAP